MNADRSSTRAAGAARAALLLLTTAAITSCERKPSPADSDSSANVAVRDSPAAASGPALHLHDRVREPRVDEAERPGAPLRIVSAAPNVTEICCALGLRPLLVGRTRYCDYPPEIEAVRSIGALIDANVEVLLELNPDLVLVSGNSRSQAERFSSVGLRFESVPDAGLNDLFDAIHHVGELTGRTRTADQLCSGIRADLAAVTERYANVPRARVLLLIGTLSDPPRPPYVAGPGSFYDDLLELAGHENVVAGGRAAFAPLSLEYIVRADPDVIIELDADGGARPAGDAGARRVWGKLGRLRAVANERVHVLTGPEHFLLGPRIALTHAALCRAIADRDHE